MTVRDVSLDPDESDVRRCPDLSLLIFTDATYGRDRKLTAVVQPFNGAASKPKGPAVRSDPKRASRAFMQGAYESVRQALISPKAAKRSVLVMKDAAAFGPDPKRAVFRRTQG